MGSSGGGSGWVGHEQQRPVWVSLSTIFGQRDAGPSHPTHSDDAGGIDTQSESPGILLHWLRANGGDWLGVVTYPVRFVSRDSEPIYLERQLVPARALRPRQYGSHRQ